MFVFAEIAKSRLVAAGVHLGCNIVVAIGLVLAVTQVWYPSALFELSKGRDIFLLLMACDVTLGPVITLLIFNVRKPRRELRRDMAIIVAVQIAAMIYGLSALLTARPAYIVYNSGQFNVPLANELHDPDDKNAKLSAPWFGPPIVGVKTPEDNKKREYFLFSAIEGRGDLFQMPKYFLAYKELVPEVLKHAKTLPELAKFLRVDEKKIAPAVQRWKSPKGKFAFLPLVIRYTTGVAVIDTATGDLVGMAALPSAYDR